MKKLNLKYVIGIFLILFMAGCKDDADSPVSVVEGLSARLNLSIQVPEVNDVTMSRGITDNESQIHSLDLFCYSVNSDLSYCVDLTDLLQEGSTMGNGYRTYTLSSDVSVQTGTFTIYAVANWDSKFASQTLSTGSMPTEDELKAMMAENSSNSIALGSGEYLPMSQVLTNQTFYEDATANHLSISLVRATAHIEFIFQDGTSLSDVNGHFEPQQYVVYNVPTQSYLFSQTDNKLADASADDYFNTLNAPQNITDGTFEFWMNENVQNAGTDISSYTDRDDVATANYNWRDHNFEHAPEYSTYVVVRGKYEDNTQIATVDYLIHLGNFSQGDNTNFTVNRNEYHTYKVTINGINSVSTTVTVNNPGAYSEDKAEKTLEFVTTPEAQDAHYVMYPIKIKTANLRGNWTVAVDDPDNHSWVTLKKESDLSDLQRLGYWTRDELGGSSVTGEDTDNTEQTIYVFMEENAERDAVERNVTLNLYKTDFPAEKKILTINQLPVNWNGDLGNERIEDGDYPWGFKWTRDVKFEYKPSGLFDSALAKVWVWLVQIFYPTLGNNMNSGGLFENPTAEINYSDFNSLNTTTAASSTDGLNNTLDLFNYTGGSADALESTLLNWGYEITDVTGENENTSEYAALMCLKKNAFTTATRGEDDGQSITVPVIEDEDVKWYLPASGQFPINDVQYPLNGDYWTSTAVPGSESAYKYTVNGNATVEDRASVLNVRAVRRAD